MNPEEKELLIRVAKQVEENNDMLKSTRSSERWGKFSKIVYWIVIITVGLYIWTIIQPVIDSAATAITEIGKVKDGVSESVSGISDSLKNVTDTLDILREKTGI
jgi:hypothetical protein